MTVYPINDPHRHSTMETRKMQKEATGYTKLSPYLEYHLQEGAEQGASFLEQSP